MLKNLLTFLKYEFFVRPDWKKLIFNRYGWGYLCLGLSSIYLSLKFYFIANILMILSIVLLMPYQKQESKYKTFFLKRPSFWWGWFIFFLLVSLVILLLRRYFSSFVFLVVSLVCYLSYRWFTGHWKGYIRENYLKGKF